MNQSIKTLEAHNAWRRGDDSPQGNPAEIGRAIDDCVQAAKRYELVRTLDKRQLNILSLRLWIGETFDEIIDNLIKAKS